MKVWIPVVGLVVVLNSVAVWHHMHGGKWSSLPSLSHIVWSFEARSPWAWLLVFIVWMVLGWHVLIRRTFPIDWGWR